ncbi:nucleotide pyrophosphohydrolase [Nitriliruptoria bacterium AS10]|nr:nucleotide pyrophosphohydrolase [Salsipaludibacter albus]MBY5162083.1 nucleotide pyrophosphohydrolase [Salsipaludibacter albus]
MALAGEAGELLAEFQWLTPDEASAVMDDPAKADAVRDELADVAIYLVRLADILGVDLAAAAHAKIDRNDERFPAPDVDPTSPIVVRGTPIAGEDPREKEWRRAVATAAAGRSPCSRLGIALALSSTRRHVDIDNLARPVLAGLRDAGVCSWGYRGLDALVVTKEVDIPGVTVALDPDVLPPAEAPALIVAFNALPGSRGFDMGAWEAAVDEAVTDQVTGPAWVDIAVRTERSLERIMKPTIDGLSPLLGRDPKAHLPFTPNDHLVERLTVRRVQSGSVLTVRAGPIRFPGADPRSTPKRGAADGG